MSPEIFAIHILPPWNSGFSQTDKVGSIGIIANFVLLYICGFLLNLQHIMLVNVKLDIKWT